MEALNLASIDPITVWLDGNIPSPGKVLTDAGLVYTEDTIFSDVITLLTRNGLSTGNNEIMLAIAVAFNEYFKQSRELGHIPDEALRTQITQCIHHGMKMVVNKEHVPTEFLKEVFRKAAGTLTYDLISFTNIDPDGEVDVIDLDVIKRFKGYVDGQFAKTKDDGEVLTAKDLNVYGYLFKFIEHWVVPMLKGEAPCQQLD